MHMIAPYRRHRRPTSLGFPFAPMMAGEFSKFSTASVMKTDISQTDDGFELSIELPGFSKEDVELELKDGYVIVSAQMKSETEESSEPTEAKAQSDTEEAPKASAESSETKETPSSDEAPESDQHHTWVRRERFFGSCQRSFYMGEDIDEENITAKFENGLLNISIPKKAQLPKPEQKRLIDIEG